MGDQSIQPNPQSPEIIAFATRMYDAARTGDTTTLEQALKAGLPANMTNDKGDSLLMLASYHGHARLTQLLLTHNADPNRLNDRGQSPIAGAVFKNETDVVHILLEAGADVDLGQPSAWEAMEVFRKQTEYEGAFAESRERMRVVKEKGGDGVGGMKGASNLA